MSLLAFAAAAASAAAQPTAVAAVAEDRFATVRVSAPRLFAMADRAIERGDAAFAERAYEALAVDPDPEVRAEALFRLGSMLAKEGRLERAAGLFRALVDLRPEATRARLEFARVLDRIGDKDGAWRQVRAVQAAGLPSEVARLVDRYSESLRSARPLGASIEIALAPDSNIARSTDSDTLGTVIGDFEIADDSKRKSGIGLALRGLAFRRIPVGGDATLLVRVNGLADLYRRSKFNDLALDFAAGPELYLGRNRIHVEAGATQRWFGQRSLVRSGRLAATLTRPLGRRSQLRISGAAALIDHRINDLQDGRSVGAAAGVERALSATTGVAFTLSADRFAARDPGYATTAWRGGMFLWRDFGRATLTAGVEAGRLRSDERLALFPERRSDRLTRFTLGASFRQLAFAGFAPVIRLVADRNRSTIAIHDYRRTRTEVGIVRAF